MNSTYKACLNLRFSKVLNLSFYFIKHQGNLAKPKMQRRLT